MSAREEILARVRSATTDRRGEGRVDRPPVVGPPGPDHPTVVDTFAENVADYRAVVHRVGAAELPRAVAEALAAAGARSVVVPSGLDRGWLRDLADDVIVHTDSPDLAAADLDRIDAAVTGSALGIATTGTVVLDHGPTQGRRAVTLVPDVHVCVVAEADVVHDVPDAVARLRPGPGGPRPLTWVSGPSATSDIELERVEGVHGPRTLVVLVVRS